MRETAFMFVTAFIKKKRFRTRNPVNFVVTLWKLAISE